jgi:hypothetical protein
MFVSYFEADAIAATTYQTNLLTNADQGVIVAFSPKPIPPTAIRGHTLPMTGQ